MDFCEQAKKPDNPIKGPFSNKLCFGFESPSCKLQIQLICMVKNTYLLNQIWENEFRFNLFCSWILSVKAVCGLHLLTMNSSKQRPPALFKLTKTCLPTPFWTLPSLLLKWPGRCQNPTDTVALVGFTADWPLTVEVIGVNGVNSRISMKLRLVSWSSLYNIIKHSILYDLSLS